jgi:hypothetical protein
VFYPCKYKKTPRLTNVVQLVVRSLEGPGVWGSGNLGVLGLLVRGGRREHTNTSHGSTLNNPIGGQSYRDGNIESPSKGYVAVTSYPF